MTRNALMTNTGGSHPDFDRAAEEIDLDEYG
jgi:hypothetical protein